MLDKFFCVPKAVGEYLLIFDRSSLENAEKGIDVIFQRKTHTAHLFWF